MKEIKQYRNESIDIIKDLSTWEHMKQVRTKFGSNNKSRSTVKLRFLFNPETPKHQYS